MCSVFFEHASERVDMLVPGAAPGPTGYDINMVKIHIGFQVKKYNLLLLLHCTTTTTIT